MTIPTLYTDRKHKFQLETLKQTRISNSISLLRLVVFLIGIASSLYFYISKLYYMLTAVSLAFFIVFVYLIYLHQRILDKKNYYSSLFDINVLEIKALKGEWKSFLEKGESFIDYDHNYSYDLDIFGDNSLFQYVNRCSTYLGKVRLGKILKSRLFDKDMINKRQEAIKELSPMVEFRQKLMAKGMQKEIKNPKELLEWVKEIDKNKLKLTYNLFFKALPIITIVMVVASSITRAIPYYIASFLLIIQYSITLLKAESRVRMVNMAEIYSKDIKAYEGMLKHIEANSFKGALLTELKNKLYNKDNTSSSQVVNGLAKLVDLMSDRRNLGYSILNIIFLLDYQFLIELEKWKVKYGNTVEGYLEVIGEIEELSSFANLSFANTDWSYPIINEGSLSLKAVEISHPLLGDKGIRNNVYLEDPDKVLLITGSNMSGKSTLLRTLGINLVLAYSGSCVCARRFVCPSLNIYSCMRVKDDLENSISSFYGEIIKIKKIVEAVDKGEKVFFLLDEIFKGTNSMDRHQGATVLIKQLSRKSAIGLVSTHDLELSKLEDEREAAVRNYHFEEYYIEDKINFDYKLKSGVSQTRNAVYLMKLAGIEIKE